MITVRGRARWKVEKRGRGSAVWRECWKGERQTVGESGREGETDSGGEWERGRDRQWGRVGERERQTLGKRVGERERMEVRLRHSEKGDRQRKRMKEWKWISFYKGSGLDSRSFHCQPLLMNKRESASVHVCMHASVHVEWRRWGKGGGEPRQSERKGVKLQESRKRWGSAMLCYFVLCCMYSNTYQQNWSHLVYLTNTWFITNDGKTGLHPLKTGVHHKHKLSLGKRDHKAPLAQTSQNPNPTSLQPHYPSPNIWHLLTPNWRKEGCKLEGGGGGGRVEGWGSWYQQTTQEWQAELVEEWKAGGDQRHVS